MLRVTALLLASVAGLPAAAAVVEIAPGNDVRAAISALQPGDELVLDGGTYDFSARFNITVAGTASQPVVIHGKDGQTALIRMNTGSQNVLEVQNSEYLTISNLHFTGGSHGIRLMSSSHITIEDNEIYQIGDVGISANSGGTYEGLVIRHNRIHDTGDTGEGMYLGCNNDGCRVMNSVIEDNYIYNTNGPTVSQGDGIELKEGSAGNVIRDNVIHDTNYPGIITYATLGNGPANIIEGNLIWNTNDNAIQSAADSTIRNNIIFGAPIALQSHQSGSPSNQMVVHNTVISNGDCIDVRNVVGSVIVANNAVYSQNGTAINLISGSTNLVTVAGNVGRGGISGAGGGFVEGKGIDADFVGASYSGTPPINVFPSPGSALVGAGSADYVTDFDFNGTARNGQADAGAYKYSSAGNPGWTLQAGFKPGTDLQTVRPTPPANLTAD